MDALLKTRIFLVLAVVILKFSTVPAQTQRRHSHIPGTRGREFLFAFPSNYDIPDQLLVQIGGLSTGDTRVDVTVPALNFHRVLTIVNTTVARVDIPIEAVCVGNGFQNTTILVRSNKDVTVQAINAKAKSVDGFLAIPSDALGTEYIIPSYTTVGNETSQFTITAKTDLTTVTIVSEQELNYGMKLNPPGEELTFALQRGQTIQFQSTIDLSGTHISSDKPVAVLSGSSCAVVPQKTSRCDHMVEMIPPVDTWGKRFSLQPLMARESGYIFRLYAARANTVVKVSGATVNLHRQGEFLEFNQLAGLPLGINADKPILLVQYAKGMQTDGVGDPFMAIIPPIEQYLNGLVTFATFDQVGSTNITSYAAISITSPSLFTLSLNDVTVLAQEPDVAVDGGMFSFGADRTVPLSAGSHVVANFMTDGLFSVVIYGFGQGVAYGLPTGYNLRKLTCSSRDPQTGNVREYDCPLQQEPLEMPEMGAQGNPGNCPPNMPSCMGNPIPCMPGQPCWPGQTPWMPGIASRNDQTWIPLPNRPPAEPLPDGVPGANIPYNLAPPPPEPLFPGQPEMPRALLPPDQQTCFPATAIIAAVSLPSISVFLFMLVLIFAILFSRYPWIPPRLNKH